MSQCDQDRCTTKVTAEDIASSVALAKQSDIVIVNVALTSTEGYDRFNLSLGDMQNELVSRVSDANPNTIVVVRCPGAVLMPWADKVRAVIVQFLPGQAAGEGLARVLFGDANPSARLPLSFPNVESQSWLRSSAQYPGESKDGNFVVSYSEDLMIGYRWFDAEHEKPLFAFGAGLSYTSFSYTAAKANSHVVSFILQNTGSLGGHEVPQLYLGFPDEEGQPPKVLRGFRRIFLKPGESKSVTFSLEERDLQVWDVVMAHWRSVSGNINFMIGASSRDIRLQGTLPSGVLVV